MDPRSPETGATNEAFSSTRWSVVLAAGELDDASSEAHRVLFELCRFYWPPLYLFLRRPGSASADAQDLTQGFFADLTATRSYARADSNPTPALSKASIYAALSAAFFARARNFCNAAQKFSEGIGNGQVSQ